MTGHIQLEGGEKAPITMLLFVIWTELCCRAGFGKSDDWCPRSVRHCHVMSRHLSVATLASQGLMCKTFAVLYSIPLPGVGHGFT